MLDRYVKAFWDKDINAIVGMLTRDAVWEMPPFTGWYAGAENIGRLIDTQCPGGVHDMPMVATSANGQPAFGLYMRQPDGSFTPVPPPGAHPRRCGQGQPRGGLLRPGAVREVRPAGVAAGRLLRSRVRPHDAHRDRSEPAARCGRAARAGDRLHPRQPGAR